MALRAVLFDLDGTLLPLDQDAFVRAYVGGITEHMRAYGYEERRLAETIGKSIHLMAKNDGTRINETVFWDVLSAEYGDAVLRDKAYFDDFYEEKFDRLKETTSPTRRAADLLLTLHGAGVRTVLATNPFFPRIATEKRIRWAGLVPEDFEYFTTFENAHFCKPNPLYYREVLEKTGLSAADCIMVGNDVEEDMIAETLGMQVFLVTDCLISRSTRDLSAFPQGDFEALFSHLTNLTHETEHL